MRENINARFDYPNDKENYLKNDLTNHLSHI